MTSSSNASVKDASVTAALFQRDLSSALQRGCLSACFRGSSQRRLLQALRGCAWAGWVLCLGSVANAASPDEEVAAEKKPARVFRVQGLKSTLEPLKGDVIDGWRLLEMGDKRLVTGAATVEACGYLRQVIVEAGNQAQGKGLKKKTHLEVPCIPSRAGLMPGAARLGLEYPPPPPEQKKPAGPAPDVALDDPRAEFAARALDFNPTPIGKLTFQPHMKAAPPMRAVSQGGVVLVRVEVTREGLTRSALLVKAPHPSAAREALRVLDGTTWYPGRVGKKKVDVVFDHVVKVPKTPRKMAGAPDEGPMNALPDVLKEKSDETRLAKAAKGKKAALAKAASKVKKPAAKKRPATSSKSQPKSGPSNEAARSLKKAAHKSKSKANAAAVLEPKDKVAKDFKVQYDEDGNPKPRGMPPSGLADNGSGTTFDGKKWPRPKMPFLKGELSHFGAIRLHNPRSAFGVGLGLNFIDGKAYGVLRPNFGIQWRDLSVVMSVPLRFQLLDTNNLNVIDPSSFASLTAGIGTFRAEDWDAALNYPYTDLLRPIRHITWGKKEDRFYVDITREHSHTIGHGQLMRRYTPNMDLDNDLLMAELDAYTDFGGLEVVGGPLPIPRVIGALVFIKPLGLFLDDYFSKSLSIGASYVTDLNAPAQLMQTQNPADGRFQYSIDEVPGAPKRFVYKNRDNILGYQVQGAGLDAELKVVKWEFIDLKLYADYSHLFFPAVLEANIEAFNAGGATAGGLLRMSFGAQVAEAEEDLPTDVLLGRTPRRLKARHALRFRAEVRGFQSQFLPSYFNTLYEADKFQLGFGPSFGANGQVDPNARATLPTKFAYLSAQANQPMRMGYYLEANYQWVDVLAVTAVYEDAWALGAGGIEAVPAARNLALHAETSGLGWLQLFATYQVHNVEDWSRAFQFSTDNELFFLGGRLQLLPILFLNLGVQRTYRIAYTDDDIGSRPISEDNAKEYRHSTIGTKNAWSAVFNVELGWQF